MARCFREERSGRSCHYKKNNDQIKQYLEYLDFASSNFPYMHCNLKPCKALLMDAIPIAFYLHKQSPLCTSRGFLR